MDFHDVLIAEDTSVLEALKMLDKSGKGGVLFVLRDGKLVAALSDGDVRRWLLKQGSLKEPISSLCNYSPQYIKAEQRKDAREIMLLQHLEALPIVNDEMEVEDVVYVYDGVKVYQGNLNLPIVIMAGGKGTRLYPYTKILPKPLIPIGDITITEHIINGFYNFGCKDFYFILNYKKNMIKAYFNELKKEYQLTYVDENKPLGTGGGVRLLHGLIKSTFVLTNCDTIIEEDFTKIYKQHKENHNLVTMICSLRNYEIPYGVVNIGKNGTLETITEKPCMSFFTNTGTYIVEPEVMHYIREGENVGFPEVIQRIKDAGESIGIFPVNENSWLDMGQFDSMEVMKEKLHI